MDDNLTALAEACELAAKLLSYCPQCLMASPGHGDECDECRDKRAESALLHHAAALRAGRVTVNEGGER